MYLEIIAGEFKGWIGWTKFFDFASDGKTRIFCVHLYDSEGSYHDTVLLSKPFFKWLGQ